MLVGRYGVEYEPEELVQMQRVAGYFLVGQADGAGQTEEGDDAMKAFLGLGYATEDAVRMCQMCVQSSEWDSWLPLYSKGVA